MFSLNFLRYSFFTRFAYLIDVGRDVGNVVVVEFVFSLVLSKLMSVVMHGQCSMRKLNLKKKIIIIEPCSDGGNKKPAKEMGSKATRFAPIRCLRNCWNVCGDSPEFVEPGSLETKIDLL